MKVSSNETVRISADEIRERLLIWPTLKTTARLYDKYYIYFKDLDHIKSVVRKQRTHLEIPYKDYVADCDKKSLWLNADVKKHCAIINLNYTYAFGIASGLFWNGELRNHTGNIAMTKDKIYLIDSSFSNQTWEADSQKDLMIEVRI